MSTADGDGVAGIRAQGAALQQNGTDWNNQGEQGDGGPQQRRSGIKKPVRVVRILAGIPVGLTENRA
jgi:hypothetical protein